MPHLLKVSTDALKLGMYVSQLDRPWIETRFMFQGVRISNLEDMDMLREKCRYVYVDVEKGVWPDHHGINHAVEIPDALALPRRKTTYQNETGLAQEMPDAEGCYQALTQSVAEIMADAKDGKQINLKGAAGTIEDMIASVKRNPEALIWLMRLKRVDDYTYTHAINSAVLAAAFGRHLGMGAGELRDLAYGTLLCDIGKMKLPQELLVKPGRLSDAEFELVKSHVGHSVDLMQQTKGVPAAAMELALTHHERFDGSGYPKQLYGRNIPVLGRMAAIVDCYEAVTSDRPYAPAISTHDAIRRMYEWRNVDFQEELIERFIQCLGVYPTGTLVELTSGEVGVVYGQNSLRRLRPKVMLILNQEKVYYGCFPIVDLMEQTSDAAGQPLAITHALDPGAYGIDMQGLFLSNDAWPEHGKART